MMADLDPILVRMQQLNSQPNQSRWVNAAQWLMAGVVALGFALMFVNLDRGTQKISELTATVERLTDTNKGLETEFLKLTEQLKRSGDRADNFNYWRMQRDRERILAMPNLGERLSGLEGLAKENESYRDLSHELIKEFFIALDADIVGTRTLKIAQEAVAAAKAAKEQADQIAKAEAAAAKAKAAEAARIAAAAAAQRRAENALSLRDERVCRNANCTSWIIP